MKCYYKFITKITISKNERKINKAIVSHLKELTLPIKYSFHFVFVTVSQRLIAAVHSNYFPVANSMVIKPGATVTKVVIGLFNYLITGVQYSIWL